MRAFLLFCVIAILIGGCASHQGTPLIQQRPIPVIATPVIPQKHRVLGEVTAEVSAAWGGLDLNSANAAISVAAQQKYGPDVDAVIGVQYSAIKGLAFGTTIGTRATGMAVQLER